MLSAMGHSHIKIRPLSSHLCIMILDESAQWVIEELMKARWEEKQNMRISSQSPSTHNINSASPFTCPQIPAIFLTLYNKR